MNWLTEDEDGVQYAYIGSLADWKAFKASGLDIPVHLEPIARSQLEASYKPALAKLHATERLALLNLLMADKALFNAYQDARRQRKGRAHDKTLNQRLLAAFRAWAPSVDDPTVADFFRSLPKAKVKGKKGWRKFEGVAISPSRRNGMRLCLDAEDASAAERRKIERMFG